MTRTIDNQEIAKFAQHANAWWDTEGPLKTLHDINETRLSFITGYMDLSGKRILDVGCGGGILAEALAKAGATVVGIDAEQHAILTAKKHAEEHALSITYHCMPIEDFQDDRFDGITCMEMLEHVAEPALVIKHCKRLLKPDGKLFLSTINRTTKAYVSAIFMAEYVLNLLPRQTHDFDKFIKPSELARILRSLDLDVLALKGLHYNPVDRSATLNEDVSVNYLLACYNALDTADGRI